MELTFTKYHGAGNDFILIDGRRSNVFLRKEQIAFLCDRHFGIGADGLMILGRDKDTQFHMTYYNSDGREGTMCGNGGRCIVLFADDLGIGGSQKTFSAIDGFHTALVERIDDLSAEITLKMKDVSSIQTLDEGYLLDTGSPHCVELVTNIDALDVVARGRPLRHNQRFATLGGVNVNFVQPLETGHFRIRTYERGVEDETLACGTGVTASALVVSRILQPGVQNFTAHAQGGTLFVSFEEQSDGGFTNILLTGPARRVFTGMIRIGEKC